jgi:crotonobetainyl-CoA:carnitine CoA-transferase CaiB-like acyl-CoA transferase
MLSGTGELVDVSMLEVLMMCLTYYPVTYFDVNKSPMRATRSIITPSVEATKDGLVGVGCGTGQQWLDFCVMVGHPEWMEDRSLFGNRTQLAPIIDAWFTTKTVDEVLELARAFRIPSAPVGNGATLPGTDHFKARSSFVRNPRDGFLQPGPPYTLHPDVLSPPRAAPLFGQDTEGHRVKVREGAQARKMAPREERKPLEKLRILDMTAFWAGPLCTHVLALLGAEVIHLESPSRPDGLRLGPGVTFEKSQWWERSAIFAALNTNKKSVALDFRSSRGHELLCDLISTCDVVVENYTPRVLDQAGLGYDVLRKLRDDLIVVRMPGLGLDGPWRDLPAFAFVIEDASGLTWLTGYPDDLPVSPYSIGDPNAGIHALSGLLLALEQRSKTGKGVLVEAAMIDAAINIASEQVIEYSASGRLLQRNGNRGPDAVPQGLYVCNDIDEFGRADEWVAIAVATDTQWLRLSEALGAPSWIFEPALRSRAGRRANEDRIDGVLAQWCAEQTSDEVLDRLLQAGVPVARVLQPHRQYDIPQAESRRFFEYLEHPVMGGARYSTIPIRFSGGPTRFHRRPAPLLGEHNREILHGLGVLDEEIRALEADGIVGQTPYRGQGG